jgi:hypothetical protein
MLCASALRHFQEMDCETRLVTPIQSTRYGQSESAMIENLKILAVIQPQQTVATDLLALRLRGFLQDCLYRQPSWPGSHSGLEFCPHRVLA